MCVLTNVNLQNSYLYFHRCIPPHYLPLDSAVSRAISFAQFVHELEASFIPIIIPMSLTGLILSVCLFFCFHFFPKITVFGILGTCIITLISFTIYTWCSFIKDTRLKDFLYLGISSSIVTFFITIFVCYFHARYKFVIEMFTEVTRATFKMPCLILLPIVTLLVLIILITSMVFLAALISTHKSLIQVELDPGIYIYKEIYVSEIGISYFVLIKIWFLAFANGCQCLIVAGPVSYYYFNRNESILRFPVLNSCLILLKFHLGSVAFGSLCVTIVTIVRVTVKFFEEHVDCKLIQKCLRHCLECVEESVEYLTKRAYIQTAMHGKSLYQSGVRAARLLWTNLLDTISLDVVGDYIMICATIAIILITIGVELIICWHCDLKMSYFWTIMTISAGIVYFIVYFFMQILNIAIETIFLCYCEDKLLNNGEDKPYLMSDKLKSLVSKAKEAARKRVE